MEEPHLISNATMQQGLGRYILEWEWAVCTFLVLNSQSIKRCRSDLIFVRFPSFSLPPPSAGKGLSAVCVALYELDAEVMEFIRRRTEKSPGAREYLMPFMRPMTPALLHLLEATKQNNVPILEAVRELDPAYCKSQDGEDKPDTTLSTHIQA